jgi:hypothetical protein
VVLENTTFRRGGGGGGREREREKGFITREHNVQEEGGERERKDLSRENTTFRRGWGERDRERIYHERTQRSGGGGGGGERKDLSREWKYLLIEDVRVLRSLCSLTCDYKEYCLLMCRHVLLKNALMFRSNILPPVSQKKTENQVLQNICKFLTDYAISHLTGLYKMSLG